MAVVTISVNFLERYRPRMAGAPLAESAAEKASIAFRAHANAASLGPRFLWTAPDNGIWYYQRVSFEIEDLHVTAAFPALQRRVLALADRCRAEADLAWSVKAAAFLSSTAAALVARARTLRRFAPRADYVAAIAGCLLGFALGTYGFESGGELQIIEQPRPGHTAQF
jgi:hypothetical protein